MDLATLVYAVLIFGAGLTSGFALGAVGLYLYLFARGIREYSVRKKAYDKFVADMEQELATSKADMRSAESSFMAFTEGLPNA